ncbi:AI-2E family transporter [Candidatus Saccharibacteria bacterium]|nr:AI-2E family transporter [Candidatus Saccharibacteria bacterium]
MSKAVHVDVDTKTFIRFWLVIIGFALAILFIGRALPALIIIGIAIFMAIAINPLVKKIDSIDAHKERRSLSVVMAVILVVLAIGAVIAFIGPVVVNETSHFISTAPEQLEKNQDLLNGINSFGQTFGITDLKEQLVTMIKDFSDNIVNNFSGIVINGVGTVANFLTATVLVVVLTILFLLQGQPLLDKLWTLIGVHNKKAGEVSSRIASRMARVISKYVSGQLTVAVLDGVVVAIVVTILSLIFGLSMGLAIPLGLIAMIFMMIPMFGPIIGCVIIALLLVFSNSWAGLSFAAFYILYQQIESNVISPKIQGKGMNLPPLVILLSITLGMYMFGLVGAIIAIPIAGCIKVLVEEYPEIKALSD